MRESIGGAMLFWIVTFLFSIFIIFIAFIIKYARVYKIKNTMINLIERNNGAITEAEFERELKLMDYEQNGRYKICRYMLGNRGEYYFIELYSTSQFPVIGNWLAFTVSIKGETRTFELKNEESGSGVPDNKRWFTGTADQCKICIVSNDSLDNSSGKSSHCKDE